MEVDLRDKRNRFQVNRVDSTAQQQQSPPTHPTLVGYKGTSDGNAENVSRCGSPFMLISPNGSDGGENNTRHGKSFRHFTREALPRLDNYRNMMSIQYNNRPTLDELHDMSLHAKSVGEGEKGEIEEYKGMVKFGWIKGVFVRCLLNIWGVMLFLRVSWCVGQAGIVQGCIIVLLATAVTFITSLSMSAISTNGTIKAGGTYYMISRSLGPEFGASIGLIFAVANAVAVAMYTVGFAESMVDLLKSLNTYVVEDPTNSVRIIGSAAIVFQTLIVCIGMEWEATAQVGLLFILVAAMIDFVIGSFVGPLSSDELSKGFVGYNGSLFLENLSPVYRTQGEDEHNFFSVFSIFFPAATGILAGANISGDLADPSSSIPKGTILAIIVTTVSYLGFAIIAGSTVLRDANGVSGNATYEELLASFSFTDCSEGGIGNSTGCAYGLMNNFQVMELVSVWGPLIYAGCFAATLSSALASLVSAPKVFQALCNDKLYPYIKFFGKGYGKNNEPVRGYVLTFFIALAFILIAELNAIAPLISNFFLAAYALVNYSTFHASLAKPVGWRPTFKYYNMWISLIGFFLCVAVMFLISWVTALCTFAAIFCLYMIVIFRKPDVNWGSSTQAQTYKNALLSVQQLNNVEPHVKNFRPQLLVLCGAPWVRPPLVDFGYLLAKKLSLIVCGHIVKGSCPNKVRTAMDLKAQSWFKAQKMKAFFCPLDGMSFEDGANALLQAYGIGRMRPNILLMGYKGDWSVCDRKELREYFNVIHRTLDLHVSVALLRVPGGLDFSKKIRFGEEEMARSHEQSKDSSLDSIPNIVNSNGNGKDEKKSGIVYKSPEGGVISRDVLESLTRFQRGYKEPWIDVWWLYDDGGLTLLLPYIISTRKAWTGCRLRVFAIANKLDEFETDQLKMAELLAKFRINFDSLHIIPDITRKAGEESMALFDRITAPFVESSDESVGISPVEIIAMREKTNRHLRLRELLQEHSRGSTLVVMTLPMPRKGVVSAALYMAWLEVLTRDMPPFLLVRGNQESVLTFYS